MEQWDPRADNLVDAIEEGRIVRVPEQYARKEGLTILRKQNIETKKITAKSEKQEEIRPSFDELRKPLGYKKTQVELELIENFQWEIAKIRRQRGITRKQFAKIINEPESSIKLLENGIIPRNDFIIINKVQSALKTNLRKDKKDFSQSVRSLLNEDKAKEAPPQEAQKIQLKQSSRPFDPFRYKHAKQSSSSSNQDNSLHLADSKSNSISEDIELIE